MSNMNDFEAAYENFEILVDIPFTMQKVDKLQRISQELIDFNGMLKKQMKRMDGCWKGNSAEAMKERLNQALSTNQMLSDELEQVANKIKMICENVYEADMNSVQRIQNIGK